MFIHYNIDQAINYFQPILMPHPHHETQLLMKQCRSLRTHGCTSYLQLQMWLEFMLQTILDRDNFFLSCGCGFRQTQKFNKNFFSAFQQLSQLQAAKYYHYMLNIIHDYVGCDKGAKDYSSPKMNTKLSLNFSKISETKSKSFSVDIIKKGFFNNTQRVHYLQIDSKKSILLIKSQNNPYDLEINLENYLCRQSKGNAKHTARKQFVIHKAGDETTPEELRFAMKDVYEYPQFFSLLWSTILQIHAKKICDIIDKLSEGGTKKGFVEIILRQSEKFLINPQSQRGLTSTDSSVTRSQSIQDYGYLDIKHPTTKVGNQYVEHFCALGQSIEDGHFLWGRQWQPTSKGCLKNINYEYIAVQRNAVKKVIKSFISMGNGETQLPIQMFSHQSNLLQLGRACKYFPYFFQQKKENHHQLQSIIVDAVKKSIASVVGFLLVRNRMDKPLKPFVGETYQGFIAGYPISLQQISQNQSYLLFQTQQFKLYGSLTLQTQINGINSISAGSKGYLTLQLKKLQRTPKICFTFPMIELSGLIYGDRLVQINGTSVVYQQQSGIFCLMNWGKNKKTGKQYEPYSQRQDFFKGEIIKLKKQKFFDLQKYIQNPKVYLKQFTKDKNYEQKKLGEFYGNWTKQLFVKGKDSQKISIFKVQEEKPSGLYHYSIPLPSDCRLRKDVKLLEEDRFTQAELEMKKGGDIEKQAQSMRNGYTKS